MFKNRVIIYTNGQSSVDTNPENRVVYVNLGNETLPVPSKKIPVGYWKVEAGKLIPMKPFERYLYCGPIARPEKFKLNIFIKRLFHYSIIVGSALLKEFLK